MHPNSKTVTRSRRDSSVVVNSVIRNTYILLSLSLVFSAITAYIGVKTNATYIPFMLMILIYFGLFALVNSFKNSPFGIVAVFALTGFLSSSSLFGLYILTSPYWPIKSFFIRALV